MYKLILVVLAAILAMATAQLIYSPYAYSAGVPVVRSYGAYPYAYGAYATPYAAYLYK